MEMKSRMACCRYPLLFCFMFIIALFTPAYGQEIRKVRLEPTIDKLSRSYQVDKIIMGIIKTDITANRLHYHLSYDIFPENGRYRFSPKICGLESFLNEDPACDKKEIAKKYVSLLETPFTTGLDFGAFSGPEEAVSPVETLRLIDVSHADGEYSEEEYRRISAQLLANDANHWIDWIGITKDVRFPLDKEFSFNLAYFYSLGGPSAYEDETPGFDYRSMLYKISAVGMVRNPNPDEYVFVFRGEVPIEDGVIAYYLSFRTTANEGVSEMRKTISFYTVVDGKRTRMYFHTDERWKRE